MGPTKTLAVAVTLLLIAAAGCERLEMQRARFATLTEAKEKGMVGDERRNVSMTLEHLVS